MVREALAVGVQEYGFLRGVPQEQRPDGPDVALQVLERGPSDRDHAFLPNG